MNTSPEKPNIIRRAAAPVMAVTALATAGVALERMDDIEPPSKNDHIVVMIEQVGGANGLVQPEAPKSVASKHTVAQVPSDLGISTTTSMPR